LRDVGLLRGSECSGVVYVAIHAREHVPAGFAFANATANAVTDRNISANGIAKLDDAGDCRRVAQNADVR